MTRSMLRSQRGLSRRMLLRGLLAGGAVAVGLPALEVFLGPNGDALADGSGFPTRFGWWFFGNGVHANRWVPAGNGPNYELSEQLAPLATVKDQVTVVSGLRVDLPNSVPHGSGPAGILYGGPLQKVGDSFDNSTFGAPTLDQVVAQAFGDATRFRSLEVAVERTTQTLSYSGPGAPNPPEFSPAALFQRLFGPGFVEPGSEPILDPKLGLRRSVLDAVSEDAKSLQKYVSASDRLRLQQHYDGIRALEQQIAKLEEDPPNLASCKKPMAPAEEYPDEGGRPQMSAIHRVHADTLAMALACDATRAFSLMFSKPVSNVLYPGASAGHHQLTHDEPGEQPEVHKIILQIVTELAYFIEALRKVPEGDGTLLDHMALLALSDCSFGKSHAIDNYPLLVVGGCNGALKRGIHYHAPAPESASKLGFTLLRALGIPATSFGTEKGVVMDGISELEA
ncbi:MAG: DUF1552 domain-containing protein [Deltaproteobacteria bacterium]|nr:DUF1552 domain-containing protein [Deltaproteobacteria bacterium]